jgi:hypothetical protein
MIVLPSKEESVTACLSFNSREGPTENATIPARFGQKARNIPGNYEPDHKVLHAKDTL